MKRLALTVCLALLLVLSGCTGLTGPATDTPADSNMSNAASVDTLAGPLPGVSTDGVSNLTATLRAGDQNTKAGFVATTNVTSVSAGSAREGRAYTNYSVRAARSGVPSLVTYRQHGAAPNRTVVTWSNQSAAATKRTVHDETTHRLREESRPARPSMVISDVLASGDFAVVNATGAGANARLVLRATGPNASANDRIQNYSGTLRLDRKGRPRSASVTYVSAASDGNVTTHVDFRLERLGDVDVTRPDWVAAASWPAPQAVFEFTSENGTGVITHHGGDTLGSAQVRITDVATNETITRSVNTTLHAGDRLYVYRSDGAIHVGTERPADARQLTETYRVVVLGGEHDAVVDQGTLRFGTSG